MKKKVKYLIFISLFYFLSQINVSAQNNNSADAIAIRVLPNPKFSSALNWYKEQGFSGSPQNLKVDGYSAIRDGRTVYVNAANIAAGIMYSNIYIISYTQEAENDTVDIFSRILKKWKFNKNLNSIPGSCRSEVNITCLSDDECPIGDVCDSNKARVVRDVNRLEDFSYLKKVLEVYKNSYGFYPKLSAGSYLPNISISTWPSWQNTLAFDLDIEIPFDPVNKLGNCGDPSYTPETCWNENSKRFYDIDVADVDLPSNSLVYVYKSSSDGQSFELCGIKESSASLPTGLCSGVGVCLSGSAL